MIRVVCLVALWAAISLRPSAAQTASIAGVVRDSTSGLAVEGVRVELWSGERVVASGATDAAGRFELAPVPPGDYVLVLARIDYRRLRTEVRVAPGVGAVPVNLSLVPAALALNPLVISASRAAQKMLDAPAPVAVVEERAVEERPALTVIDHVYGSPGLDIATTGITQHVVVARGFNNAGSTALLTLTDNRYASLPSLRINVFNFIPATNDDIERIEVVRGPGAALYGPNAANGVLHLVTKSPLEGTGSTASVAVGTRGLTTVTLRHASRLTPSLGAKISAQYLTARDFPFEDPTERLNREQAIAAGADPDTLRIGRRDSSVERISAEARLDWRVDPRSTLSLHAGVNQAVSNVDVTGVGAAQVRDWRYVFVQAQVSRGRFFAQTFVNASDAGDTYLLRTGAPIVDRSRMWVAQAQHGVTLAGRTHLTYGIDLQRTDPRTGGTITGRNESDDVIDEAGAYLHSETMASSRMQVVAAIRGDLHSRIPGPVLSPRVALVFRPASDHSVRLAYNRAFFTPNTNDLFLDLVADSVRFAGGALPFALRVYGVPKEGFHFRRDCGGLCMRSPFTPASLGGPGAYLPIDGTVLWSGIVDSLAARGLDLSGIPAPTTADVGTNVRLIDGLTGLPEPIETVADIPPLRPGITNEIELGYRGLVAGRVVVAAEAYFSRRSDFVGPLRIETPTAHFDSAGLANYLDNYLPVDSARFLAGLGARLPLGTISPEEARDPWDLIITNRNFGGVNLWGADFELGVLLAPGLGVYGTYSWTSKDLYPNLDNIADVALNAPANKAAARAEYYEPDGRYSAEVRMRWVAGFPVNSGVYVGAVESYAVADAQVGYRLPWTRRVLVTAAVQNIFDSRHTEFIGTPRIGRVLIARVRAEF